MERIRVSAHDISLSGNESFLGATSHQAVGSKPCRTRLWARYVDKFRVSEAGGDMWKESGLNFVVTALIHR